MVEQAAAVHIFFREEPTILPGHLPLVVVPNGIEPPAAMEWDGGSSGSMTWLGRFDIEHKGLDLLVDAVDLLPSRSRPSIDLYGHDWLGGRGRMARHIHERGLGGWLRLHPPILGRDKWDVLAASRGFVYPSRWEAYGLAPAEAASIGLPSLVTPFPLARILASRGAATLTDATPRALAEGLETFGASTSTTPTSGVMVMKEVFSWPVVARSWRDQVAAFLGPPVHPSL
jgi:glycosyltransferase involved in cell wall biosynthesis